MSLQEGAKSGLGASDSIHCIDERRRRCSQQREENGPRLPSNQAVQTGATAPDGNTRASEARCTRAGKSRKEEELRTGWLKEKLERWIIIPPLSPPPSLYPCPSQRLLTIPAQWYTEPHLLTLCLWTTMPPPPHLLSLHAFPSHVTMCKRVRHPGLKSQLSHYHAVWS